MIRHATRHRGELVTFPILYVRDLSIEVAGSFLHSLHDEMLTYPDRWKHHQQGQWGRDVNILPRVVIERGSPLVLERNYSPALLPEFKLHTAGAWTCGEPQVWVIFVCPADGLVWQDGYWREPTIAAKLASRLWGRPRLIPT